MDTPAAASETPPRSARRFALVADERLAALSAAGSERAFAALYRRYHQPLYRYCRSLLRDDADAQDALQGTFASAYAALRKSRRDAPLRPWLYRIAHNEAISMLRRRRTHADLADVELAGGPSAEDQAAGRERLAQLVADLHQLPDRQRGALVMRELSGLSHEEIALALGGSVGTAKQTIFEARRSLQEFAEGRAMSCDEVCRALSDGDRRVLRGRRVAAHLRDCAACAAFAVAIPKRRADLRALALPIAPLAAAGLLGRVLGHGAGQGGARSASLGLAGKSAGLAVASKAVVGAALLAGVTVGLSRTLPGSHRASQAPRTVSVSRSVAGRAHHAALGTTTGSSRPRRAATGPAKAFKAPAGHPHPNQVSAGSLPAAGAGASAHRLEHARHSHVGGPSSSRRPATTTEHGNGSAGAHRPATATPAPRARGEARRTEASRAPAAPAHGSPSKPAQAPAAREEAQPLAHVGSPRETP